MAYAKKQSGRANVAPGADEAMALSALADPTRRAVFARLRHGPMAVSAIAKGMTVSRPAVSQHLKLLKDAHLVSETRDGTRRLYRLEARGLDAVRRWFDQFWDDALSRFAAHAEAAPPQTPLPKPSKGKRRG